MSFIKKIYTALGMMLLHPQHFTHKCVGKLFRSRKFIRCYQKSLLPLIVRKVSRKRVINVLFLTMNPDMWRYDNVFKRMMEDSRFNPMVVTAMRSNLPLIDQIKEQEQMIAYFSSKGYPVKKGYDMEAGKWIDIRNLKPDILFYTQPYTWGIESSFEYYNFPGCLFCYSPYSFQMSKAGWNWNNLLQNFCWKLFLVGQYQVSVAKEMMDNKGNNVFACGYCLEEEYSILNTNQKEIDAVWKNDSRKRVIWAPHHSINKKELFKVSSFLEIADGMVEIRKKYEKEIVFAFKPHPVLKGKLDALWGRERANAYYDGWANSGNSFYAPGEYKALFAGSDAMIHCSGSFIVEYLYSNHPVQYVYSKYRNPPDLGEIGEAALGAHYSANSLSDIERFLNDVVLGKKDFLQQKRKEVAGKYLKSPNGKMFSENVMDIILSGLGKEGE